MTTVPYVSFTHHQMFILMPSWHHANNFESVKSVDSTWTTALVLCLSHCATLVGIATSHKCYSSKILNVRNQSHYQFDKFE